MTSPDYQRRHFGTASGTNAYSVTLSPAPASYITGQLFTVTFTNGNSAAATLDANGLGAKAIKLNGAALTGGQIAAGAVLGLVYNGANLEVVSGIDVSGLQSLLHAAMGGI